MKKRTQTTETFENVRDGMQNAGNTAIDGARTAAVAVRDFSQEHKALTYGVIGTAGALALGALAYNILSNRNSR